MPHPSSTTLHNLDLRHNGTTEDDLVAAATVDVASVAES